MSRLPSILNIPLPTYPRMARQAAPVEPLTSEEESSLLNRTLSGLSYLAESFDKPGAAVRGLMAGEPEQLLNLIPFSDTLGITDPEDKVYGRDLLEQWGILGPNTKGLDVGDVAGLGLEILTDPLNMIVGPGKAVVRGAFDQFGPAAKAVQGLAGSKLIRKSADVAVESLQAGGKGMRRTPVSSPRALADDILRGDRGLVALSTPWPLPGSSRPLGDWAIVGRGSKTAANILNRMGYGKYAGVPLRTLRYMFDPDLRGVAPWGKMAGEVVEAVDIGRMAKGNLDDAMIDFTANVAGEMGALGKVWTQQAEHAGRLGDAAWMKDLDRISRELTEFTDGLKHGSSELADMRRAAAQLPSDMPKDAFQSFLDVEDTARRYHAVLESTFKVKDTLYKNLEEMGLDKSKDLIDGYIKNHWPRYIDPLSMNKTDRKAGQHLYDTFFGSKMQRRIREVPGGTLTIERAVTDPLIHGFSNVKDKAGKYIKAKDQLEQLKDYVARNNVPVDGDSLKAYKKAVLVHKHFMPGITRTGAMPVEQGLAAKADEFLKWMGGLPSHTSQEGVFNQGWLQDFSSYLQSGANVYGSLATIHHVIRKHPGLKHLPAGETPEGMVSVRELLMQTVGTPEGPRVRRLISDKGTQKLTRDWATENGVEYTDDLASQLFVPESTRGVLAAQAEAMQPWAPTRLGEVFDKMTNLWKGAQTVMFPGFHFRNLISGIYNSAAEGTVGFRELTMESKRVAGALIGEGRQSLEYIAEVDVGDILKLRTGGRYVEAVGEEAARAATRLPSGPLRADYFTDPLLKGWGSSGEGVMKLWPDKLKPWRWRGVVDEVSEGVGQAFIGSEAGDKAYALVEFMNRYVPYSLYRKKGFTSAQAAHKVLMTQFDYSKLSPFMRRIGKRAFPFATWITKNMPYQFSRLMNMPGGMTAQTLRAINMPQRSDEGYVPSFLREGGAIRTGGTDQAAHFARWLGLPVEDLGRLKFTEGLPDVGKTVGRFGSDLHPLFQWPIEAYSGKDMFTGRKVKDMKGLTGIPNFDTMLSGMPWERLRVTIKMMVDERKPGWMRLVNLLSGLKFGTYDVGKWKLLDAQRVAEQILEESPEIGEFSRLYIKDKENVSEEIQEQYDRSLQISKLVRDLIAQQEAAEQAEGQTSTP